MSIGKGEWKLWREGEPFNQRFTATISEDVNSIEGRWEYDEGNGWQTDFDLVYTSALGSLDHVAGAGFQVAAGATATKAAKELGLVRTESAECC